MGQRRKRRPEVVEARTLELQRCGLAAAPQRRLVELAVVVARLGGAARGQGVDHTVILASLRWRDKVEVTLCAGPPARAGPALWFRGRGGLRAGPCGLQ